MKKLSIIFLFLCINTYMYAQNDNVKQIYVTVLKELNKCDNGITSYVLKKYSMTGNASYQYIKDMHYSKIDSVTIENYLTKDSIDLSFISCASIKRILPELEINEKMESLQKEFADNLKILEFTSVGINPSENQAILSYYEQGESYLSAEGNWIILEKINGEWIIVKKINSIVY